MSKLATVTAFEIGGRTFQIRTLTFSDQRKMYGKLQRVLMAHGDDVLKDANIGLFMFAGLAGLIPDDDLATFCDVFGKTTDVDLGDGRTLVLSNDVNRTIVFSDHFEDLFAWLDACIEVNFARVMEKVSGAKKSLELATKAKTERSQ